MAPAKPKKNSEKSSEESRREQFQKALGKALLVAVFLTFGFLNISNGPQSKVEASIAAGNWDGWIKLSDGTNWGMKLNADRTFSGFSYGGSAEDGGLSPSDPDTHVIGWISWNCADIGTCTGLDIDFKTELPGAPTLTLTGPGTINYGNTATLEWTIGNDADSCDGESIDNSAWNNKDLPAGVFGVADYSNGDHIWTTPGGLITDYVPFKLTCSNTVGPTIRSVTVNVRAFALSLIGNPANTLTVDRTVSSISDKDHSIVISPWGSFGARGETVTLTCENLPSGAECRFDTTDVSLIVSSFGAGNPIPLQVRKILRLTSGVTFTIVGTTNTGIVHPYPVRLEPAAGSGTFRPPKIKEVD